MLATILSIMIWICLFVLIFLGVRYIYRKIKEYKANKKKINKKEE